MTGGLTHARLLELCLAKPGAWEDEPWEGDVVAKVGPKIFAFLGRPPDPGEPLSVGLKAGSRAEADEWLLQYPEDATAMAYLGRHGWNTLRLGGSIPDEEIAEAVDASYRLVVATLPKRQRPPEPAGERRGAVTGRRTGAAPAAQTGPARRV